MWLEYPRAQIRTGESGVRIGRARSQPDARPLATLAAAALLALLIGPAPTAKAEETGAGPTEAPSLLVPLPPPVPELSPSLTRPKGREHYLALLSREAGRLGLPPAIADAVARVESGYDPRVVGLAGEVGLMQVMPPTAALLGFKGTVDELSDPEINIRYGVTYLAQAWRLAGGQLCQTLMKYRAGHGEARMTQRSVDYCLRARLHLASIGSDLANAPVPVVTAAPMPAMTVASTAPGANPGASFQKVRDNRAAGQPRLRTPEVSQRFWAEHEARIKRIKAQLAFSRVAHR